MKKLQLLVLLSVVSLSWTFADEDSIPIVLRVMTFNIRNGKAKDGPNHWEHRKDFVCEVIRNYAPDVLGVQEAFRFQMDEFNRNLPEFGEIGVGRDGGKKNEYCAILYLKKRFEVTDSGTFWLSDTPDKPSTDWGNYNLRICTWAWLLDKHSRKTFYVFNTHLDHRSQPSREKSAELIMKRIDTRKKGAPFILMGDFNAGEDNSVIRHIKKSAVDTFRVIHPEKKEVGTFSRFSGYLDGAKIDYIFTPPTTRVSGASIVRTQRDGRNPSDHYPVTATLQFPIIKP